MAVALLEQGTTQFQASSSTPFVWTDTFVLSSGANTCLVLEAAFGTNNTGTNPTGFALTANGVSMTVVGSQQNANTTIVLFGLSPFTVAASSFNLSWTNAAEVKLQAQTLQGANQSGSSQTFTNFTFGAGSSNITVPINSNGDLIISGAGTTIGPPSYVAPASSLWTDTRGAFINGVGGQQSAPTAGSTTISISLGCQILAAMDVIAASTAGSTAATPFTFSTPSMYPTRKVSVVSY